MSEIVVTASPVINKTDRKVILPDKETLRTSTNGIDLLRKLQLARISVNPLTNDITTSGGGSVVLCINGVEATSVQISAIRPEDVVRIDYHDNPGVRYAGADAVIDYIITRHDSGGNIVLDAFGAFESGRYASIDNFSGQYTRGRSVWNVNAGFMGQQKDKWSIHLGVFNAFLKNYWMKTRNLSALAPYQSKAHSGRNSSYVAVKFNLSLDFGRKGRSVELPEIDNDSGSGILTGTK